MKTIFISYRRQHGYELAHLVNAELRARGLKTFIDVADSDPGKFWPQIQATIRRCRSLVLICTTRSFETREGDDWVLREVSEAMMLGRPIIPVFSQNFKPPSVLPAPLANAIEYNGVTMDTQFHVAAFDHLAQMVGGRKRSEQRKRVAVVGSLLASTLLASLAFGGREIFRLTEEFRVERQARQAADARGDQLERDLAAQARRMADERLAAEQRQRDEQARAMQAQRDGEHRRFVCAADCGSKKRECESSCFSRLDGTAREDCKDLCARDEPLCRSACR